MHKPQVCRTLLVAASAVAILSCNGGDATGPAPTPVAASVASVTVTSTIQNITVGSSASLTATTLDANGNVLTGRTVTWSSSNSDIARVNDQGSVTGVAVGGPVTITATSEGKSGTSVFTIVAIPVASVTVSPTAPTIMVGATTQLSASTLDASGNALTGRAVTWTSSNTAIASVSSTGLVTGLTVGGPVTITATSEGKSGSASVTVIPVPPASVASVIVSPPSPSITIGTTTQLTASTLDSDGNVLTGRAVVWSSSNSAIASVSASGLVTGVAVGGPVTITATSEGKSGTATVNVTAIPVTPVATVTVSPSAPTIIVGSTVQLTASTLDADGNALTGRSITWASSNSSIASVSATGLVTAITAGGPITITATSEGKSGTATITVNAIAPIPVASITVTPPAQNMFVGAETQLTAVTLDANGNTLTGRSIVWSSSNDAVATVSASGLVRGITPGGPVTITATSEGKNGTATVTVIALPVGIVTVSPPSPTIIAGASVQLTASTFDSDGNPLPGRVVTWSSSNTAVATVSNSGLVTGVAAGAAVTITATSEGRTGTATVTVTVIPVPVASVTVSPPSPTITVGTGIQLSATTFDALNNVLTGRTITWSSSNSSIASVNSSGLVVGLVVGGPVTITATSEGISGSSSVTIAPIPFSGIRTGISNAVNFVDQCPTTDPAYATIRADFTFLRDGLPDAVSVTCTAPFSTVPIAQLTDELIAVQALRIIYYMSQGTAGRLPWTSLSMYDWLKASVSGINFHSAQGLSACCDVIGGNRYIITSQKDATSRDFYRDWNALSGWVALFAHEARHVTGPGHTTGCPAFPLPTDPPGCDATYDLNNLGSYGVQYWLFSNWTTGFLNVGLGCSSPSVALNNANWAAGAANGYVSRFITNAPPTITPTVPYGGPCLGP